jgi:hypothetical protein
MWGILKQSIERITTLRSSQFDTTGERDLFVNFEQRFKGLRRWYESQPRSDPETSIQDVSSTFGDGSNLNMGGPAQQLLPQDIPYDFAPNTPMINDFSYPNGMFDMNFREYLAELDPQNLDGMMQFSYDQL